MEQKSSVSIAEIEDQEVNNFKSNKELVKLVKNNLDSELASMEIRN